jgi:hypothetical protein
MEAASCQICAVFAARDVLWAGLSRVDARRSYWDGRPGLSDLTRRSNTSANARCRRRRRRPLQAANVSACGDAALRRPGCRVNVTWSRHVHALASRACMPRECASRGMQVHGRTRRGAEQQGAAGLAAPLVVLPRPGMYGCGGNGARPGWPDRRCIHSASRDRARGATPTQPASSSIRRRGPCCVASRCWRQTRVRGQPRSPGQPRPEHTA